MPQEPTLEFADLLNLIQVPWLSERFFNPTMPGGCQEDTMIFLMQWFNKHPWIHTPSRKCLGGSTGVLPVVLALGRLHSNVQAAVAPELGVLAEVPAYVTSEILTPRELQHVQKLIGVLTQQLEDSIGFASTNYYDHQRCFTLLEKRNTALLVTLSTATGDKGTQSLEQARTLQISSSNMSLLDENLEVEPDGQLQVLRNDGM